MQENKVYTAIGMMSGTSLDGIDVALVKTDGMDRCELLDFQCFSYTEEQRAAIRKSFGAREANKDTALAEQLLTQAHIDAIKKSGFDADIIGFHGQTIMHDPAQRFTWQLGDSQRLANETCIDVIGDMRQADVKAGGQGAPLLPLCHRALASAVEKPVVILNMGGVANITWLGEGQEDILAFDTGPANALMDDFILKRTGEKFDIDGQLAESGTPDFDLVDKWLEHSYFKRMPPKSLDRDQWDVSAIDKYDTKDGVATLAYFTIQSIIRSMDFLPQEPTALYAGGGGSKNTYIMSELSKAFNFPVVSVEKLNWNADALEAQGFAYLAVRSLKDLPLTVPGTTGVEKAMTGGNRYTPA